jgi:hypothetical protein
MTATTTNVKRMHIRAYVDPNKENMGLERYGLPMYDGVPQFEPLGYIEKNGVKKYLTGLDESAPEILALPPEKREAAIKDIRETVAALIHMIEGGDKPDPSLKNKEFWNQCKRLAPTNEEFWGKDVTYPNGFTLELYNAGMLLTMDNYMDILVARAIKAGGYKCLIASSLQEAQENARSTPHKFYLDYLEDTSATQTELRKLTNKAKAVLDELRDSNVEKLRIIAICFDSNPTQYKATTPADVIYFNIDRAIDGELWEKSRKVAASTFLALSKLSSEELNIKYLTKVAAVYRFIDTKKDGYVYYMETGTVLGRNMEEVEVFLKNPIHEDILITLKKAVEKEMNR